MKKYVTILFKNGRVLSRSIEGKDVFDTSIKSVQPNSALKECRLPGFHFISYDEVACIAVTDEPLEVK